MRANKAAAILLAVAAAWAGHAAEPGYSIRELLGMARKGDVEARWQLGRKYENGDGVEQNHMRAAVHYRKAAEAGHHGASARLAAMYSRGVGVAKNYELAAKYHAMASGRDAEKAVAAVRNRMAQNAAAVRDESAVREETAESGGGNGWGSGGGSWGGGTRNTASEGAGGDTARREREREESAGSVAEMKKKVAELQAEAKRGNAEAWLKLARIFNPRRRSYAWIDTEDGRRVWEDPAAGMKSYVRAVAAYRSYLARTTKDTGIWEEAFHAIFGGMDAYGKDDQKELYEFVLDKSESLLGNDPENSNLLYYNGASGLEMRRFKVECDVEGRLRDYIAVVKSSRGKIDRDKRVRDSQERLAQAVEWEEKYENRLRQSGTENALNRLRSLGYEKERRRHLRREAEEADRGGRSGAKQLILPD